MADRETQIKRLKDLASSLGGELVLTPYGYVFAQPGETADVLSERAKEEKKLVREHPEVLDWARNLALPDEPDTA